MLPPQLLTNLFYTQKTAWFFYFDRSSIHSKINLDYEDHKMAPISLKDKLYTSLESAHRDLRIHLIRYTLF
jgi:hypothetical protein